MARSLQTIRVCTPAAASYLWRISDARLRRLALDGALPFRTVKGWGRKACRVYDFEACRARWGEPDPDALDLLLRLELIQIANRGGVRFELFTPRPVVVDHNGDLATSMENHDS